MKTDLAWVGMMLMASTAGAQALPPDQAAMKAHVVFLASDALKGREAGTAEYEIAAEYVAARRLDAGLVPAGENGTWLQKVPLVASRPAAEPSLTLTGMAGEAVPLVFNTNFSLRATAGPEKIDVSAPVVFAGYGVVDAATGRDDYRGLDVRGKIVAVLYSGPKGLNGEVAAHLGNRLDRARLAKARGAVGILYLWTSQIESVLPFAMMTRSWDSKVMAWANPDGSERDLGAPALGVVGFSGAEKLFAGSKIRWSDVRSADDAGRKLPTGPLAVTAHARQSFIVERQPSSNVVGRLPGSDPALADEVVLLTGHLDHIGITRPVNGDSINNGALDNALGIASLLEAAKLFQSASVRPRRSILFVAVTAEEKGLIGAEFFATFPTVPRDKMIANVNLDMPILLTPLKDLIAFGAARSSIGAAVEAAARGQGLALTPDPNPEEASFVRTDHYPFVRQGIPAVTLATGPGGEGKAATENFLKNHYHKPSDDLSQPIDWAAARVFVKVNYEIARSLADAPERPRWVAGDYFGTLYKGPMAAK